MTDLTIFEFESRPVRIAVRDGEPWFVGSDICTILDISNSRDAMSRLDDDERDDVGITDTIGRLQQMAVVSESGLFALIFTSRKPAARAFRKWVTAEVLPSIRRTGSYSLSGHAAATDLTTEHIRVCNGLLRTAQSLFGAVGARDLWPQLGLPPLALPRDERDDLAHLVAVWIEGRDRFTYAELAEGIGLGAPDHHMKSRLSDVLGLMGWEYKRTRRGMTQIWAWHRPMRSIVQGGRHD